VLKAAIYFLSAFLTYSLAQGQAPQDIPVVLGPAPAPVALTFTAWKQLQISDAQAQVKKLSTARRVDPKLVARAKETLANASELTVEEYVSVYLSALTNDRETLVKLAEKLTKDETADIIATLLRRIDAEQNKPVPVATSGSTTLVK
jgi:hypothetical protein